MLYNSTTMNYRAKKYVLHSVIFCKKITRLSTRVVRVRDNVSEKLYVSPESLATDQTRFTSVQSLNCIDSYTQCDSDVNQWMMMSVKNYMTSVFANLLDKM